MFSHGLKKEHGYYTIHNADGQWDALMLLQSCPCCCEHEQKMENNTNFFERFIGIY